MIVDNYGYGISIYSNSNNNIFHHNNILDNTSPVFSSGINSWDNGEGEGNYWSDYTGSDNGSNGRIAGDGVGDTDLPHQGVDWYPLMEPWVPTFKIENIKQIIEEMNLPDGISESLIIILDNAIYSFENYQKTAGINQLNAFIYYVEALKGKKLTDEEANTLISEVQWILNFITS